MMRNTLWLHILEDLGPPQGCILPIWLRIVYVCIFPLQGLRIALGPSNGFDIMRNVYTIHGVEVAAVAFLHLSRANGELYRIRNINGICTLERVEAP